MKIVLATRNRGKAEEIKHILKGLGVEILTLDEYPSLELPPEAGLTFRDNALGKARFVALKTGLPALADDSGLEVDSISGAPGVFSARYAGTGASDEDNYRKLLGELAGVPEDRRTARFRCVVAFAEPGGGEASFEGSLGGVISTEPKGKNGFGYDPVFYLPEKKKTVAELSPDEKNVISHRAKALEKLKIWLTEKNKNFKKKF